MDFRVFKTQEQKNGDNYWNYSDIGEKYKAWKFFKMLRYFTSK